MTARRVLVINGSLDLNDAVDCLQETLGVEVFVERDGQSGIQSARDTRPDLILLDSKTTDVDGQQLCNRLLEVLELKNTPMIIVSPQEESNGQQNTQESESIVLVHQSISPEELAGVCERFLHDPARSRRSTKPRDQSQPGNPKSKKSSNSHTTSSRKVKFAMRGYLNMVSTGEVLQLLKHKEHSGLLRITSGTNRLDVFINKGDIALARSHAKEEEFLLGRFLFEAGVLDADDLDQVLREHSDDQSLIGERLVQLGHITRGQLNTAIQNQTEALVYESLRWQEGEFLFFVTKQMPREVREAGLGLSVEHVLMEGFQRVYEWSMIEQEIKDLDKVLTPGQQTQDIKAQIKSLEPKEREILALVDGYRSVREIIRLSRRSSFDVCSTLFRLLSYKILVKRPPLELLE